jgi:hypothetical protein
VASSPLDESLCHRSIVVDRAEWVAPADGIAIADEEANGSTLSRDVLLPFTRFLDGSVWVLSPDAVLGLGPDSVGRVAVEAGELGQVWVNDQVASARLVGGDR